MAASRMEGTFLPKTQRSRSLGLEQSVAQKWGVEEEPAALKHLYSK